jgi:hypothetical protein
VWTFDGVSCAPWEIYPEERYFELGDPLPAHEFVRGEVALLDTPARVDPEVILGEDGSRDFIGLHDGELGARCHIALTVDGAYRCVPDGAYAWGYHDAACTQAVAAQPSSCDTPPAYAKQFGYDGCVSSTRVFAVAGPASGAVYGDFGDECIAGIQQPDQSYFLVGAELPPDSFSAWQLVPAAEGGRLRPYLFRSDDGLTYAARLWYDLQREEDCTIAFASDGRLRCLPYDTTYGERYFRDATCQTELEIADATPSCGQTPTMATLGDLSCPRRITLRSLGAPLPAGTRTYLDRGGGECSELPLGEGVYVELGEEISPAGYGELTLATDPGPTGPPP